MKQAVIGYITALIDTHSRKLDLPINPIVKEYDKQFVSELNDLLDFIEDIPEEKQPKETITVVFNANKHGGRV